jgi:hypothetical protein
MFRDMTVIGSGSAWAGVSWEINKKEKAETNTT